MKRSERKESMNKPIRVIEGSAKPFEPFWLLRNADESDSGEPEIEFYGAISEYSWWEDDVTPAKFKADLNNLGQGGPITIRIHSGGGDVFAASAIRAMIMDYPGRVTARIDGLCASAATYVAMAGDRVLMQDSAFFMIHDPWTIAWGGVDELKSAISLLKTVKAGIIETYQSKTNLETEKLAKMMADETWMTAQQAQEMGFVDEVISAPAKTFDAGRNMAILNCLSNYERVPEALLAIEEQQEPGEPTETNVAEEAAASEAAEPVAEETEPADPEPDPVELDAAEAQKLRDYLEIFGPRGDHA
jgi:ATP-dependent Clp protease protease subunit